MKLAIMAIKELIIDLTNGAKKTKVIIIILIIPFVLIYCLFSYTTSWFTDLFVDEVEVCLKNSTIRNTAFAFIEGIEELEIEKSEKFIKKYFIDSDKNCLLPDESIYDKIQDEYNLTDKQVDKILNYIISMTEYSGYSNVGEAGYVSTVNYVTSCYGPRWGAMHKGIDISGGGNPPIYAYDKGTVYESSYNNIFGFYVILMHSDELYTRYFHLYEPGIAPGTEVEKGQQIGVMGTTGDSTGVHLHFEILVNGNQIDPYPYLITTGETCL